MIEIFFFEQPDIGGKIEIEHNYLSRWLVFKMEYRIPKVMLKLKVTKCLFKEN